MNITINADKAKAIHNDKQRAARAVAFAAEYDPLVGKHLRGEATQDDLIAKAAEIRDRFPYLD